MDRERQEAEVDRNFDAFHEELARLLPDHRGEHALLKGGQVQGFFLTVADALAAGRARFVDGLYSVQEVTDRPVDLGFFSHAVHSRIAG